MTRPTRIGATSSNAISHIRYSSLTGMTSSCAATWNTLSADVYTIGLPVRTCSPPSRSMISVPEATTLPSVRRPIRCSKDSMMSGGKPSGNVANGSIEDDPHHLPMTGHRVLPRRRLRHPPVRRSSDRLHRRHRGRRRGRARASEDAGCEAGTRRRCCRACCCPDRRRPAASGNSPQPTLSSTIRTTRGKAVGSR